MGVSSILRGIAETSVLRKADVSRFPDLFANIERTVVIWPRDPDESTVAMAKGIYEVMGDRIAGGVSFKKAPPIKRGETIVLGDRDIGLFGRPKRASAKRLSGFTASIDLSPDFDLPISALPAMAGIGLRIGRDRSRIGSAYNLIVSGGMGKTLKEILEFERKNGKKVS